MTPTPPPQKIVVYLRVSRPSQEFPSQLHALREFVRRHGWKFPAGKMIFAEKAGGTKVNRTQLDRMLTLCRTGHVDAILCYQINRIGRSLLHLVNLLEELDKAKIRVIGVNDDFDSFDEGAYAKKRRNDMINDAQFERDRIIERTRDGVSAARAAGRVGGKPRKNEQAIIAFLRLVAADKIAGPADPGARGGGDSTAKAKGSVLLKKAGKLSLRQAAEKVGLSASYLSKILREKKRKGK
jgi:DNA invertase Pin-like site-specific DNA recombinase